jgi:hypothetical protein
MSEPRYCLDTSVLINPWRKMWPIDVLPSYWAGITAMNADGRALLSEEVRRELERKDDQLHAWAKEHIATWHPLTGAIQECVREIMARWGKLVDQRPGHGSADPFVIATALVSGTIVVTDESPVGTEAKPKIPYVCNELGVTWIGALDFVRLTLKEAS